ncbi:MAG: hypothetical protein WCW35_06945 [Bacteroidota bacterium]
MLTRLFDLLQYKRDHLYQKWGTTTTFYCGISFLVGFTFQILTAQIIIKDSIEIIPKRIAFDTAQASTTKALRENEILMPANSYIAVKVGRTYDSRRGLNVVDLFVNENVISDIYSHSGQTFLYGPFQEGTPVTFGLTKRPLQQWFWKYESSGMRITAGAEGTYGVFQWLNGWWYDRADCNPPSCWALGVWDFQVSVSVNMWLDWLSVESDLQEVKYTETTALNIYPVGKNGFLFPLPSDAPITFTIPQNDEYGTFIYNNDTIKTEHPELTVPFGDVNAGKVYFAAVRKNPTATIACTIEANVQTIPEVTGTTEVIVQPAQSLVDHFEVTMEKDTVAFTESGAIKVQAKNAENQDIEFGADEQLKLSLTTNAEYGTFIDKHGDTLKTSPVELNHIPYGDANTGLIQFSAVKKNPNDPLLCKVQVELERDVTRKGEKEIPVVEQSLKIVMDGVREVIPRNLIGAAIAPLATEENKKYFIVKLTRNKAAVSNHSFKLTTDYIDGTGGHDHVPTAFARRPENTQLQKRSNYGYFILRRDRMNYDRPYNGKTQVDGRELFDYVSSIFGDRIRLKIETMQSNKKHLLWDTLSLAEKVPSLSVLTDGEDLDLIGGRPEHNANHNHFSTQDVSTYVQRIAAEYRQQFPSESVLKINDMSLPYGGRFDIFGQWNGNTDHKYHRRGTDVDIRSRSIPDDDTYRDINHNGQYDRGEPITMDFNGNGEFDYTNTAFEEICQDNNVVEADLEWPGVIGREHYHLYFQRY